MLVQLVLFEYILNLRISQKCHKPVTFEISKEVCPRFSYNWNLQYYCKKFITSARAIIPGTISISNTLMIVETILTTLRLSSLFTQMIEGSRPTSADMILTIAHTERTPSGRVTLRNTGTSVTSGSRLTTSTASRWGNKSDSCKSMRLSWTRRFLFTSRRLNEAW